MTRIVDLTHTVSPLTPRSTDHPQVEFKSVRWFSRHGIRTHTVYASLHSGTHIDAPSLYLPDGYNIDDIPIERLFGPGIILDVRRDEWGVIGAADLDAIGHDVQEGDNVILCCGWGQYYGRDEEKYQLRSPGLDKSGVDWLVSRGVNAVGIDASSSEHVFMRLPQWKGVRPDIFGDVDADPAQFPSAYGHTELFRNDILVVDHVGGPLDSLLGVRCTIGLMCAKYGGVEGAPARVFALVD